MTVLSVQIIFSFVLLNGFQLYDAGAVQRDSHFFILITIIAVCFTVLPLFLNLYALVKINSATVGILMYINPLINFTIAFLVFHEQVSVLQVGGYCLIAVALVVFNYPNFRKLQALRSPS